MLCVLPLGHCDYPVWVICLYLGSEALLQHGCLACLCRRPVQANGFPWHEAVRAAFSMTQQLPGMDSNHERRSQNPLCCQLHHPGPAASVLNFRDLPLVVKHRFCDARMLVAIEDSAKTCATAVPGRRRLSGCVTHPEHGSLRAKGFAPPYAVAK